MLSIFNYLCKSQVWGVGYCYCLSPVSPVLSPLSSFSNVRATLSPLSTVSISGGGRQIWGGEFCSCRAMLKQQTVKMLALDLRPLGIVSDARGTGFGAMSWAGSLVYCLTLSVPAFKIKASFSVILNCLDLFWNKLIINKKGWLINDGTIGCRKPFSTCCFWSVIPIYHKKRVNILKESFTTRKYVKEPTTLLYWEKLRVQYKLKIKFAHVL